MDDYLHLLTRLKTYLGIDKADSTSDALLLLMLEDAINAVLSYCHVKKLKGALDSVVVNLVLRRFKAENEGLLSGLKMGDVSLSYQSPISAETLTDTDKAILNAYRRVVLR